MGTDIINSFREYREKMNEKLLAQDNKVIKRIFNLDKCFEHKVNTVEIMELFALANLNGGTIVIPHTRRALEYWEELKKTGG